MARRLRFRGESRHKVDGKGRVSIPSSFRDVLRASDPDCKGGNDEIIPDALPNFVMVYGNPAYNFIECYTIEEIERIEDGIDAMEHGYKRDILEEIFSSHAMPASVDNTGRIVIPAKLREKFGIGGEAVMVASLNTFRIWDAEAYDAEKANRDIKLASQLPRNPLEWLSQKGDG